LRRGAAVTAEFGETVAGEKFQAPGGSEAENGVLGGEEEVNVAGRIGGGFAPGAGR